MLNPFQFKLTPMQTRASLLICDALPTFPKTLADLVTSYCSYENLITLAQDPKALKVGIVDPSLSASYGCDIARLIECPENHEYSVAVRYCLSASDCNPIIKQKIIRSLLNYDHTKFWPMEPYYDVLNLKGEVCSSFGMLVLNELLGAMRNESMLIDLNNVDLSGMNLRGIKLNDATAIGARFEGAHLVGAALFYADLTGSDLRRANITYAKLDGAILCNAKLQEARFSGSSLCYANVTGAKFCNTSLSTFETDRTYVTGLITSDQSLNTFLGRFKKYFSNEVIISGRVHLTSTRKENDETSCVIT